MEMGNWPTKTGNEQHSFTHLNMIKDPTYGIIWFAYWCSVESMQNGHPLGPKKSTDLFGSRRWWTCGRFVRLKNWEDGDVRQVEMMRKSYQNMKMFKFQKKTVLQLERWFSYSYTLIQLIVIFYQRCSTVPRRASSSENPKTHPMKY